MASNTERIARMSTGLSNQGFDVRAANKGHLAGTEAGNICNRGRSGAGAQLETAEGLRRTLFRQLSPRAKRQHTTAAFIRFVAAVARPSWAIRFRPFDKKGLTRRLAGQPRNSVPRSWSLKLVCSVSEVNGAEGENWVFSIARKRCRKTQCSLFPIYRRLPSLDVKTSLGRTAHGWSSTSSGCTRLAHKFLLLRVQPEQNRDFVSMRKLILRISSNRRSGPVFSYKSRC